LRGTGGGERSAAVQVFSKIKNTHALRGYAANDPNCISVTKNLYIDYIGNTYAYCKKNNPKSVSWCDPVKTMK
jgi:hypothetical protein